MQESSKSLKPSPSSINSSLRYERGVSHTLNTTSDPMMGKYLT